MNYDVIAEDLLNESKVKVFKSLMILILLPTPGQNKLSSNYILLD